MKTTDLHDSRNSKIHTEGRNISAYGFCNLRVDAGFEPEDPDHSRGYVRLELDRETEQGGGIATRVLRAATVCRGELKDVLEIHSLGDCESHALGEALVYAGLRLMREALPTEYAGGEKGLLFDSPYGSSWRKTALTLKEQIVQGYQREDLNVRRESCGGAQ